MRAIEIREELHYFANQSDDKTLKKFYEIAKDYIVQIRKDKMIAESEEDIKAGRIHSQDDVQKMIESWVKK